MGRMDNGRKKSSMISTYCTRSWATELSVLRANLLCQWYNQRALLVYLDTLGHPGTSVIPSIEWAGSQPGICSDLTRRKPSPALPHMPHHWQGKPAEWKLKHTVIFKYIYIYFQALESELKLILKLLSSSVCLQALFRRECLYPSLMNNNTGDSCDMLRFSSSSKYQLPAVGPIGARLHNP